MDYKKLRKLLDEKAIVEEEIAKIDNDIKYSEETLVTLKKNKSTFTKRNAELVKEIDTTTKGS